MRRITSVLFTVTGRGPFPTDMLRHDACWPADTGSALSILRPLMNGVLEVPRTVHLRTTSGWGHYAGPSVARWASFGWGCEVTRADVDGEDITEEVRRASASA